MVELATEAFRRCEQEQWHKLDAIKLFLNRRFTEAELRNVSESWNIATTKPDADTYQDELVELRKVGRQLAEQADHCLVGYSIEWIAFAEAMQGRFDCKDAVDAPLAEG